jgi:tetratricopeptide (TPR) repeat protein
MARWLLFAAALPLLGANRTFELRGQLVPAVPAQVSLHGATSPFESTTLCGPDGRFRFRNLLAGSYTVVVFQAQRGEHRLTIDVGPSAADKNGRIEIAIRLDEAKLVRETAHTVSARSLKVPEAARKLYQEASKKLAQRDIEGAKAALGRAVELAPGFASAWNHLGTIAYQTRQYPEAERFFRRGLEADPDAFEPLVNLGGVLLTLGRPGEAWSCNIQSVLKRPTDALANSQLGMNYLDLGKPDLADKYLREAVRLDPGHFSHPQLLLAEIAYRRARPLEAADWLDHFIRHHPDWPTAEKIKAEIERLRGALTRPKA